MTSRHWITLGIIAALAFILIANASGPAAWASVSSPPNQTVPTKTPKPAPTKPPQPKEPTDTPQPLPTGVSPTLTLPADTTTYTVQAGDTLFQIAQNFNLTLDHLLALNPGLTRESILQIGQVLKIAGPIPTLTSQPTVTATSAATATSTAATTAAPTATPTIAPTQIQVSATASSAPTAMPTTPAAAPVANVSPSAPASTPTTAADGSSGLWLLIIAAALIVGGGVLVFRRRRT